MCYKLCPTSYGGFNSTTGTRCSPPYDLPASTPNAYQRTASSSSSSNNICKYTTQMDEPTMAHRSPTRQSMWKCRAGLAPARIQRGGVAPQRKMCADATQTHHIETNATSKNIDPAMTSTSPPPLPPRLLTTKTTTTHQCIQAAPSVPYLDVSVFAPPDLNAPPSPEHRGSQPPFVLACRAHHLVAMWRGESTLIPSRPPRIIASPEIPSLP